MRTMDTIDMPGTVDAPAAERPAPRREMDSDTGLVLPGIGRTLRLFARAFTLRCPHCGGGPVLEHWLRLRVKCGHCQLRLQRGEHDAFPGAIFILFTLAGFTGYLLLVLALALTETTPWTLLEYGLPVLTVALMFAYFPFAKLGWLAFDMMLRPVSAREMEWHRSADAEFSTERDASRD